MVGGLIVVLDCARLSVFVCGFFLISRLFRVGISPGLSHHNPNTDHHHTNYYYHYYYYDFLNKQR